MEYSDWLEIFYAEKLIFVSALKNINFRFNIGSSFEGASFNFFFLSVSLYSDGRAKFDSHAFNANNQTDSTSNLAKTLEN